MTATPVERRAEPLRVLMAEEIRALMARRRLSGVALAAKIDRSQSYVSRRLTGDVAFDLDDLERIASALGVKPADLLPSSGGRPVQPTPARVTRAVRPPDGRPKNRPSSGLAHGRTRQKRDLTPEERALIAA